MENSVRRTAVLFGAGASVDAGLPQTQALAREVLETANKRNPYTSAGGPAAWVQALNFIYGSMVEYGSRKGGNPLEAVDFERLVSAIRLLKNPGSHESAPFVMNWKPGSDGFSVANPRISSHSFESAFNNAVDGAIKRYRNRSSELFREICSISGSKPELRKSFEDAEDKVFVIVKEILGELKDTQYLRPLAELANRQNGGLDVLTLNYDLAVETMASTQKVNVFYGFDEWRPGTKLRWKHEAGNLNLIKMHGSLNWRETHQRSFLPHVKAETDLAPVSVKPWIVLGDKEKLATKGPTLDLLHAAEEALERADHLVVAGYSFADEHINDLIFAWLEGNESRSIAVVDPGFPMHKIVWREEKSARNYLLKAYSLRLKIFRNKTSEALGTALSCFPDCLPSHWFDYRVEEIEGGKCRIRLSLLGPDLATIRFYCSYMSENGDGESINVSFPATELLNQVNPSCDPTLNEWASGETKTLIVEPQNNREICLRISAYTLENEAPVREKLVFKTAGG